MQNQTVVAALIADPIPPERECVSNFSSIAQNIVDLIKIDVLASVSQGSPFVTSNNIAQQALETANTALSTANAVQAAQPARRTSGTQVAIPSGDSVLVLSWPEPMPSATYEVHITLIGAIAHPTAYYGWRVVDGTATANNVQVCLDNIPATSSIIWSVTSL